MALVLGALLIPSGAGAATFDVRFYRYCAPNTFCGFATDQDFKDRICDSVQEMNLIWEVTGTSFRPQILPIDSDDPTVPPPGAPANYDKYYEVTGCVDNAGNDALRLLFDATISQADTTAIPFLLVEGPRGCCSGIPRTNKPPGQIKLTCDANRSVLATGSLWAHEMGHNWSLSHTHGGCQDTVETDPNPPANDPDASPSGFQCNAKPADPDDDVECDDDAYCQSISAGTCEQDQLPVVNDTPADWCGLERVPRGCSGDVTKKCSTDDDCGSDGTCSVCRPVACAFDSSIACKISFDCQNASAGPCICKTDGDENVIFNLIDGHEWVASVGNEREIVALMGATDDGSPHATYCDVEVKQRINGVTSKKNVPATLVRNVLSYHGAGCRGPYVINGVRYEAFTDDQLTRIGEARVQITARANLPDVCANRGGDSDHDGICDQDDGCPDDKNTCQRDTDGDDVQDACDLCPQNPNPTGDNDDDKIGDICDPDDDNDGCCDPDVSIRGCLTDQHPTEANPIVGSKFNGTCGFGTEPVYGHEGDDTDDDGRPNCADPDDDNDGICDDDMAQPNGTPGTPRGGCTAGPDNCPEQAGFGCQLQGSPVLCPPPWLVCLGGGCVEFFLKFVSVINPAEEIVVDEFSIFNQRFYFAASVGMTPSEAAMDIQGLAAGAAGQGLAAGGGAHGLPGRVRMEVWSRQDNRRVAIVGEFDRASLMLGPVTRGAMLSLTPMMGAAGAPMLKIVTTFGAGVESEDLEPDADGDGRPNAFDNCLMAGNPFQSDSDGDGFGNGCDGDLDGDGVITQTDVDAIDDCVGTDLGVEQPELELGSHDPPEPPVYQPVDLDPVKVERRQRCAAADLNEDQMVDQNDRRIALLMLGQPPGPSGFVGGPLGARIVIATVSGAPGFITEVPVTLQTNGLMVSGTQNDIMFTPQAPIAATGTGRPDCTENPSLNKQGSVFGFQPPGCTPGVSCTGVRAIIVDTANFDLIPDGPELYSCVVDVPASTPLGTYPLPCSAAEGGDPDGNFVPASCRDGAVEIERARSQCAGDCNRDLRVVVSELIRGVNIALDRQPLTNCEAFDISGDGKVAINELVTGVRNALDGCS